ncbi:hypothetical protein GCM10010260_13010 [Streptomyces filipinensis]|uniref:Tyr recombinase domain-containing protein n=1 Tax=Streptomyces filipinensis TaxID=66887 RepID=A0A918M9N0_9ACTN|nr:site-specific integrase [Streptomyces filipinensis]GGU81875.1 hypothetical protein GCM10010260_13010 [Streptomyces filipinensis]
MQKRRPGEKVAPSDPGLALGSTCDHGLAGCGGRRLGGVGAVAGPGVEVRSRTAARKTALTVLKTAMKAHLRDFPADGSKGLVFTAPQGGPVVYTHFMDGSWRPACAKAGIPRGTGPHALRYHYASLLIKHGESVKTVSERLGHTNAAMTLNIDTHLWLASEERTRAAVDQAYADRSADAQPQVDEAT